MESENGQSWPQPGKHLAATIVLLARADLLSACKPDEIAELAATAYPITFERGDRLIVEGAESLECYAIEEGEAEVTIDGKLIRAVASGCSTSCDSATRTDRFETRCRGAPPAGDFCGNLPSYGPDRRGRALHPI